MRKFCFYFFGWIYVVLTSPALLLVIVCDKLKLIDARDQITYRYLRRLARVLIWLTGSRVTVKGEENLPKKGPVVFIANHPGHFDSAVILGYINMPKGFVSIVEAKNFFIISTWMKYAHCVFMDRKDLRQSLTTINEAIDYVNQGYSMVIFPEGQLNHGQGVGEFKRGSLKLATKPSVPIVPLTITGTEIILGEDNSKIEPANLRLVISKPIETKDLTNDELKELPGKVRDIVVSKL
ncbi:MAG: 1-acyl-sn-glycerol-3-phosphate acyltransferase [Firmicutes bacterium]|nr:1-acyl-sn-glycerol-3-phosphate acyltransferase [Bacillota bacterium]